MAKASEVEAFWAGAAPEGRARYSDLKLIGSGAYSVVARARDTQTDEIVAIKRIAEVFYDAQEAKKVLREIRLLRDFAHPNVISLKALIPPTSMETFDDIFMVTDFMESDLRRVIKSKQQLPPGKVRSYMAQLLAGLEHVHRHSGIHRDLKPANVLVSHTKVTPATPYGLVRLCDFGLARVDADAQARACGPRTAPPRGDEAVPARPPPPLIPSCPPRLPSPRLLLPTPPQSPRRRRLAAAPDEMRCMHVRVRAPSPSTQPTRLQDARPESALTARPVCGATMVVVVAPRAPASLPPTLGYRRLLTAAPLCAAFAKCLTFES